MTAAITQTGTSRDQILRELLHADSPLVVDHLTRKLQISRNATYQHVTALERDGLIRKARRAQTRGRPGQTYELTEAGQAYFPKHYALFANLLIGMVKSRLGSDELETCMADLGRTLAAQFSDRIEGLSGRELIGEVAGIMRELGYESEAVAGPAENDLEIKAHNCVFHDLARDHAEVCSLDVTLISNLTGREADHVECVVRGGTCCRFKLKP